MPVSLPHGTALLLGEPGRLPFLGHFRFRCERGAVRLSGAGRVAARADAESAFAAARAIEQVLARAEGADRRAILRDAFSRMTAGELILVAQDATGAEAAAIGIEAWWAVSSSGVILALPPPTGEPMLVDAAIVVGAPAGLVLAAPTLADVSARCGVHA
jgi:hypothetical protein